jgi:hypothetical protein
VASGNLFNAVNNLKNLSATLGHKLDEIYCGRPPRLSLYSQNFINVLNLKYIFKKISSCTIYLCYKE